MGFVPTMGALHRGHLRLIEVARERADLVVVSVFVNPTQFGPSEDFERYPRDLEADREASGSAGADLVYAPAIEAIYPPGFSTEVVVRGPSRGLCGACRPGHFAGVATVVTKLFNQVGPCCAVFGRKDYQQLKVIERMVRDLDLEVEVVGVPTVREPDGLALSSRNAYLDRDQRRRALSLIRGLSAAAAIFARGGGGVVAGELRRAARGPMEEDFDRVDYVEVCHPETVEVLDDGAAIGDRALVAAAGWLGATRLIDNLVLGEDSAPLDRAAP